MSVKEPQQYFLSRSIIILKTMTTKNYKKIFYLGAIFGALLAITIIIAPIMNADGGARKRYVRIIDGKKYVSSQPFDNETPLPGQDNESTKVFFRTNVNRPTEVGSNYAQVSATYYTGNCPVTTRIVYGDSPLSLSNTTNEYRPAKRIGTFDRIITKLEPNTTYFYRAVTTGCDQVSLSTIRSFTTNKTYYPSNPTSPNTNPTNTQPTQNNGIVEDKITHESTETNPPVALNISNDTDNVTEDDVVTYEISIANKVNTKIENTVLEIKLSEGLKFLDSSEGAFDRKQNTVFVNIGSLLNSATVDVTARVKKVKFEDTTLVTEAILAYENTELGGQENVIAYDYDQYYTPEANDETAEKGTFFPNNTIGWILSILLIIMIIILSRFVLSKPNK